MFHFMSVHSKMILNNMSTDRGYWIIPNEYSRGAVTKVTDIKSRGSGSADEVSTSPHPSLIFDIVTCRDLLIKNGQASKPRLHCGMLYQPILNQPIIIISIARR